MLTFAPHSAAEPQESIAEMRAMSHYYDRALTDSASNVLHDEAGALRQFREKLVALRRGDEEVVTVLHIGDSHVQGGVWSNRVRGLLQAEFGNAGRGIVVPYRLAGMNEPSDYAITTPWAHHAVKGAGVSPTNVAVTFDVPFNELKIWSKEPFSCVTLLHTAGAPELAEPEELNTGMYCDFYNTPQSTRIPLRREVDSLTLSGYVHGTQNDPTFWGVSLENEHPGILYHAVGLNGAAFESFAHVARGELAELRPDLIIISLGTNNCFGNNFRAGTLYNVVDGFVRDLKLAYPQSSILLTTPMEACRRARGGYVPNENIAEVVQIIAGAARDNDVAFWDFYTASGGKGAMARWSKRGLANSDRVHLNTEGYTLQGDMLYDAICRWWNME